MVLKRRKERLVCLCFCVVDGKDWHKRLESRCSKRGRKEDGIKIQALERRNCSLSQEQKRGKMKVKIFWGKVERSHVWYIWERSRRSYLLRVKRLGRHLGFGFSREDLKIRIVGTIRKGWLEKNKMSKWHWGLIRANTGIGSNQDSLVIFQQCLVQFIQL